MTPSLCDLLLTYSYHNNNPEGIHTLMMLYSDRGTPASLRNMNAYGNHTFKFTKEVSLPYNFETYDRMTRSFTSNFTSSPIKV